MSGASSDVKDIKVWVKVLAKGVGGFGFPDVTQFDSNPCCQFRKHIVKKI